MGRMNVEDIELLMVKYLLAEPIEGLPHCFLITDYHKTYSVTSIPDDNGYRYMGCDYTFEPLHNPRDYFWLADKFESAHTILPKEYWDMDHILVNLEETNPIELMEIAVKFISDFVGLENPICSKCDSKDKCMYTQKCLKCK